MEVAYLKTLFAYDDWANRECLESLRRVLAPPSRACDVMAHIVGCQWLWLSRLKRERNPPPVWPQLTLVECAGQLQQLADAWTEYLVLFSSTARPKPIDYTNSNGENWVSNAEDILTHVVIHSGYHRGQIAMALGRLGHKPAYTDYIHCLRQGLIERSPPPSPDSF